MMIVVAGDVDSRLKEVHDQLKVSQTKENLLESQLAERNNKLQQLEQEMRAHKKRHLDEMRNAAQNISSLKAEVEAKSNNIAFLTTELHRLKIKQKMEAAAAEQVGGDSGPTIVRRTQPQYNHLPTPPRDMLTNSARLRHRGAHTVASPSVRRVGAIPSASGTSLNNAEGDFLARSLRVTSASARSSGSESPDITPFVQRELDLSVPFVEVKKPAPLPPIAATHSELGARDVCLGERDIHKVIISKRGRRGVARARPSTPEVTRLAVDQVSDSNWNRPSESHSSEYN